MNVQKRVEWLRTAQPRTEKGRELLRYVGGDLDGDYVRRCIVLIEEQAARLTRGIVADDGYDEPLP